MKKIAISLLLLLSACATTASPPAVVVNSCTPAAQLMVPEAPLAPVTDAKLTEAQIIEHWLNDDARLIGLISSKNALVAHINKYCK